MLGRDSIIGTRPELSPPLVLGSDTGCTRRSRLLDEAPVDALELDALAETEALNRVLDLLRRELDLS